MNNKSLHGGSGAAPYDRDREIDERHRAIQQHEEMARREQERERERERERDRDRDSGDRYQSTPHHSSAGSIPIHQPVASRISGAIHSPGGLLANHNGNVPPVPLGAPTGGPLATFGGPLQSEHSRQLQHAASQGGANPQHQMFAPMPHTSGPPPTAQAATSGAAAVFGGPLQQQPDGQRAPQSNNPFPGVAASVQHIPGGISQGQQPILNVSGS